VTFFTRHAHLDDIFKMAENMNSDEIIDEVLSVFSSSIKVLWCLQRKVGIADWQYQLYSEDTKGL
jgi:hypothetical protein